VHPSIKATLQFFLVLVFFYVVTAPGRAASDLCDSHPVGSPIEHFENMEGTFFLKLMGPLPDPDRPSTQSASFCAILSMCDASCRFVVKDGVVIEAKFLAL
jgi:hypothetical protein